MIDLRLLRDDPDRVRASQRARGEDPALVDALLSADQRRRSALTRFESLRAEQRVLGKQVAAARGDERAALVEKAQALAAEVKAAEAEANEAEGLLAKLQLEISNVIEDGVPAGGEDNYVVLEHVGTPRDFAAAGFEPRDHVELGRMLNAIDVERGAKVSGSRFFYLRGYGAILEHAIMSLCQDVAQEEGFVPLSVPNLVLEDIMRGTGFLDTHPEDIYQLELDKLYLIGTSEVSLVGYHADEIVDLDAGPIRYTATSTCYRREAGSHGQDTRGIFRTHQFQKTEMVTLCRQEDAAHEHERLLAIERRILDAVDVPYRVIEVAAGDLGSSAARKYDCEAWVPSQRRYRELTSTSNCTTFQARRLNIRERVKSGSGTRAVATLNGTMATTRWIVAILENHQQADGSIAVPAALRPYLGRETLTPGVA